MDRCLGLAAQAFLLLATSMLATRPAIAARPMPAAAILPPATPRRFCGGLAPVRDGRASSGGATSSAEVRGMRGRSSVIFSSSVV